MTDQTEPVCGLPHYTYAETRCTHPAGHTGSHAAPWIVDGRECGAAAWDAPTPNAGESTTSVTEAMLPGQVDRSDGQPPADAEAWRTDPRERLLAAIDHTWARGELDATPEQLVNDFAATVRADVGPDPAVTVDKTPAPDGLRAELAELREMYQQQSAANASYRLQIDELIRRTSEYADRAIANGQRAERAEAELAALRAVARGYCPACGRGDCAPTAEDWETERQRAQRAEAAIAQVRAECDRITTAVRANPTNADFDGAYLAAIRHIRAALDQEPAAPPPPGSTRAQLPAEILNLLPPRSYLSTACETARLCHGAAIAHPDRAGELTQWRERLHDRCRLNHKFTGRLCFCRCHQAPPDDTPEG